MSSGERELPTWELARLDAERARDEARDLQEVAREARARSELQVERAQRARRLSDRITVHLATSFAAYDLARELDEPVEIITRPDGTDAEVRVTEGHTRALLHIRDWARHYGFETVDMTVLGVAYTLTP